MNHLTGGTEAFFLPFADGRRFALFHRPAGTPRTAWVFVHAFAEEMNFTRRMAALQARRLASAGMAVLQLDLAGCGDSDGDFSAATWNGWVDDVLAGVAWLAGQTGATVGLCGMRAGCLLACAAVTRANEPMPLLLCAPVVDGDAHWRQFRRLGRIGAALSASKAQPAGPADHEEIAGYVVGAELREGLCASRLQLPSQTSGLGVVEVVSEGAMADERLDILVREAVAGAGGDKVRHERIDASPFWQIPEAEDSATLVAATAQVAMEIA